METKWNELEQTDSPKFFKWFREYWHNMEKKSSSSFPSDASTSRVGPSSSFTCEASTSRVGPLPPTISGSSDPPVQGSVQSHPTHSPHLTVSCDEFASQVNLPHSTVVAVWQKAETLLKSETGIVCAPGMLSSWYVESKSKQMPHLVRVSLKVPFLVIKCASIIVLLVYAIAHKHGSLEAFTKSFIKKKGIRSPNLGNFALTGMPAGRNRKGDIPPRKRLPKSASSLLPHLPLDVSNLEEDSTSGSSSVPANSGTRK